MPDPPTSTASSQPTTSDSAASRTGPAGTSNRTALTAILLPGLDGTVEVRENFLQALHHHLPTTVIPFPRDRIITYEEAEEFTRQHLPDDGRPFALIAYSFHGPVAVRIAASTTRPPGLVALVLVSTFVRLPAFIPRRLLAALIHPVLFRMPVPNALVALLTGCNIAKVVNLLQQAKSEVAGEVLAGRLREAIRADARDALHRVPVPMLQLLSTSDLIVLKMAQTIIHSIRPDTQVVAIPGGHGVLECAPDRAAEVIAAFLLNLPESGAPAIKDDA